MAGDIYQELSAEVAGMVSEGRRAPHLVLVRVGGDPASGSYVRNKTRAANKIGENPEIIFIQRESSFWFPFTLQVILQ